MAFQSDRYRIRDWAAETSESIKARLEGVKTSQGQTRLTLAVMALVCTMMIIASYNAYLSYDYGWILEKVDQKWSGNEKTVDGVLAEQAFKDWASARTVSISLLGIRVSVDDSAVLGTGVLFVLSLWLVLVTRRENHTIGFLLRDTDTPHPSLRDKNDPEQDVESHGKRWLILHSILSNSLFVTVDETMASVSSLDSPSALGGDLHGFKDVLSKAGFTVFRSFFFLFPVVSALFVFVIDRRSYFIRDPFEPGAPIPGTGPFYWESALIFVCCWLPLTACCLRAKRYSTTTQHVLREYERKLREDLEDGARSARDDHPRGDRGPRG